MKINEIIKQLTKSEKILGHNLNINQIDLNSRLWQDAIVRVNRETKEESDLSEIYSDSKIQNSLSNNNKINNSLENENYYFNKRCHFLNQENQNNFKKKQIGDNNSKDKNVKIIEKQKFNNQNNQENKYNKNNFISRGRDIKIQKKEIRNIG